MTPSPPLLRTTTTLRAILLTLMLAIAALFAYALDYWREARDELVTISSRVSDLRLEYLRLNQEVLGAGKELQRRAELVGDTGEKSAMQEQPESLSPHQDHHDGPRERLSESPVIDLHETLGRTIGLLELALLNATEGRKAEERVSYLTQAKQLLQRHRQFDEEVKLVDVEIANALNFRQLEEHIPAELLQYLSHMTRRLTPLQNIGAIESGGSFHAPAWPGAYWRRGLRDHLKTARRALHDQEDVRYHTALRNLEQDYLRYFHPEPAFGNTLQKLQRIQIAAPPQGLQIRRLIEQLIKHKGFPIEVENSLSRD